MVDRNQLPRINELYRQWNQLDQAVHNLDNGGRINSMVIVGETPDVPSAVVNTQGWPYPPQMVEGIKQIAYAQMRSIEDELEGIGLTGMEVPIERQVARRRDQTV